MELPALLAMFLDRWNAHDVDAVVALYTPDAVMRDPLLDTPLRGAGALRAYYRQQWAATPNATLAAAGAAADDRAIAWAWRYAGSGTSGPWCHVGVSFFSLHDGRIARDDAVWQP